MILVTGGTGFLGSHLLRKIVATNQPVKALYRTSSNFNLVKDIQHKVEWVKTDVLDLPALNDALQHVDEVYHAAAMVSFEKKHHQQMMQINVEGTENVVNMALQNGVKKLAFISSVAALGRVETNNIINEKTNWQNGSFNTKYAISKMLAEREVFRAAAEGLNVVVVNPSIMLGYGHWHEGSAAFFKSIFSGLPYYTKGINAFVDVNDVAEITLQLMQKNVFGERFILAENNYSYQQIFSWIANYLNTKPPHIEIGNWLLQLGWRAENVKTFFTKNKSIITRETATTAGLKCFYANEKIKKELNFNFTPIENTIKETAKIFLKQYELGNKKAFLKN